MAMQTPLDELAQCMENIFVGHVDCYFWRLSGNHPNSLSQLLCITEEETRSLLRLIGVYNGASDQVSKNSLEQLCRIKLSGCDFAQYKHNQWVAGDYFIKIGKGKELLKAKDLYNKSDGKLNIFPVEGKHMRKVSRTQKAALANLVELSKRNAKPAAAVPRKEKVQPPREELKSYIRQLMESSIRKGKATLELRPVRTIRRIVDSTVKEDIQKLIDDVKNKMLEMEENEKVEEALTPDAATSGGVAFVSPPTEDNNQTIRQLDMEVEEDDDRSVHTTATDDFIKELKEETVLQSLLLKRIHEKKERVFSLEHRNGRKMMVLLPPDTQSVTTFVAEGKKWIDALLDTDEKVEGMLTHIAKRKPDLYRSVAKKKNIPINKATLNTPQTVAMARVGNLNDVRLKNIKSFLSKVGGVNIQCSAAVRKELDKEVGLDRTTDNVQFGSHPFEWSDIKKHETKEPEEVHCWNADVFAEIEAEVDSYTSHLFQELPNLNTNVPSISCTGDGFKDEGITTLIGGDHGDKHCPINCKLNLPSPAKRKAMGKLNYKCPVAEFASIKCSKDVCELLDITIMPAIKRQLLKLKSSAMLTVHDKTKARETFRSHTVPNNIVEETISFRPVQGSDAVLLTHGCGDNRLELSHGSITLEDPFKETSYFNLRASVTVKRFNELFIGDLAFLAMLIGMKNSSGAHCLMCERKSAQFNCDNDTPSPENPMRSKERLEFCLEQCLLGHGTKANYRGVNCEGLLTIDPQRTIVPMLHCPMGLIDKALESFKFYINMEVEDYCDDQDLSSARTLYRLATQDYENCVRLHNEAKQELEANKGNEDIKKVEQERDAARKKAKKKRTSTKATFDELIKKHNSRKSSLHQQFEVMFRKNGVKREHYHGGKFNGVNCIRIMDKAEETFLGTAEQDGFLSRALAKKQSTASEDDIRSKLRAHAKLLHALDAIWSNVRGIDSGLIPTQEQMATLRKAIASGKKQWLDLGIGTGQPKWHLTFDGHLADQVERFQGLADKSDESVEKFHQDLKELRVRFRSILSYEQQETCIRRELRRKRSSRVQTHIDKYEEKAKQKQGTKRKQQASERQEKKKEEKKARREAAMS